MGASYKRSTVDRTSSLQGVINYLEDQAKTLDEIRFNVITLPSAYRELEALGYKAEAKAAKEAHDAIEAAWDALKKARVKANIASKMAKDIRA